MGAQSKPQPAPPTPLAKELRERIARDGPISVHDYMQACLADRRAGYYATRQPIGREGDFVTAPEISQIFGELIGIWVAAIWQSMGEPASAIVAELGPGRGTLMADALRVFKSVPKLLDSVTVALVETSPV
ncbi:MAG: SAM-dependent methyltransferase, partial [Methyloceanibacter sp.]